MTIHLRQELTGRLVRAVYGGYDDLAAVWEDRAAHNPRFPPSRRRASLYRWVSHGVPTSTDGSDHRYFGLCALLDVDPLVLFDFDKNGYFSRFARIRQLVYYGRASLGGLATLLDMYRPADVWPSEHIATACYGRGWHGCQISNRDDWNNTNYIRIRARFEAAFGNLPKAVHIAYRRIGVRDTMWRFYGTVLAIDGKLELYNESGDFQHSAQESPDEIAFRTYFGGRPVEWRIASLHPFKVDTEYPHNDPATIGFTW